MIFVLSMIDSLLALYTKLKGGKCLIYIGREGPMRSSVWLADNFHPSDSFSIPTFNPASNKARLQKSACPEST